MYKCLHSFESSYPVCIYHSHFEQTNKQIVYYPQTLYSEQGVKTSNKYIDIDDREWFSVLNHRWSRVSSSNMHK
jgi:hypothetical protein